MARDLITIATCDPCAEDGLGDVTAVATHVISIDGKPATEIDVCARDSRTIRWFLHVCMEKGRQVEHKEARLAKAVKTRQRKELEQAPQEPEPAPEPAAKKKAKATTGTKDRLRVICTESHPTSGGGPRDISFQDRSSHVDQCHPGMRIWDVVWVYPKDREWFPCTAHAECMKTSPPLSFPSLKGVGHHIKACKLPRIDIDTDVPKEVP